MNRPPRKDSLSGDRLKARSCASQHREEDQLRGPTAAFFSTDNRPSLNSRIKKFPSIYNRHYYDDDSDVQEVLHLNGHLLKVKPGWTLHSTAHELKHENEFHCIVLISSRLHLLRCQQDIMLFHRSK